ncbi:MAG: hypothetical protein IMZ44_04755 [Planctomycetes bacterium]|nr:hypothetical protein [Planctomycetota bacterium]
MVTGILHEVSPVPGPGRTPYQEPILALHLAEIGGQGRNEDDDAVVYLWVMRGSVLAAAARLCPGDLFTLRLRPWSDVADEYERVYRSQLHDRQLQLREPCWGEVVKR